MNKQNEELTLNDKVKFDSKGGAILGVLEGPVADYVHKTRNDRHYSEKLWENVLKNPIVQEQFRNGGIVGELDHPADRDDICTEKVAVIMPEPPVKQKNGSYWGKFNILDTPCGRIVHTLAKAGFKLGVSSRGTGDVDEYTNEVDPSTYEFTCFDVVLLPAVESARMNLVTESLDTKKNKFNYKEVLKEDINKSDEESKNVMKETLEHIGIKLDEEDGHMSKKVCVICGNEFDGYGNNAEPVKSGLCCDECNIKEVIPARLKQLKGEDLTEAKKDDEKKEKESDEDLVVTAETPVPTETTTELTTEIAPEENGEILEPETIDDLEIEKDSCCVDDAKLIELLHKFLDKEGLELDGEGEEEKHFIELYHEVVCPECADGEGAEEASASEDKEEVPAEPEVEDNESSEVVEQLQAMLKENSSLKEEVKALQEEKAVSGAKVSSLTEQLNSFKSVAANAGKKAIELKSLETKQNDLEKENNSLKEELSKAKSKSDFQDTRISKLRESREELKSKVNALDEENKKLKESLETAKKDSDKKLTESKGIIAKAKSLVEQYKKLAHQNANRYIEQKARGLGISKNEIINRLDEKYTLDDVDRICEDLQDYSINISRLPFAFDKPGDAKIRVREDVSKSPLKSMDSYYDDTVDDFLLDLAGLKKEN